MDKKQPEEQLNKEGFLHIYEWHDEPGTEYPSHAHKGKVAMYILQGDLAFRFGNEEFRLKEGDRFDAPVGKEHTAKVGLEGCTFLVGEMIEGDS